MIAPLEKNDCRRMAVICSVQKLSENPEVSNCASGPSNPVEESNGSIEETPLTGEELRLKEGGWFQVKIPWVIGRYLG